MDEHIPAERRHWDYTTYPPEIQEIVKVLLECQDMISDGYGHYSDARESLTEIANRILATQKG